ncbi:DsbA family protein [Nocardia terpenica]|uniref:DsbA family protein n=1 Tax=Nocardia terpenica TaxID=455432 RepID=UPI00082B67F9|nr:thioredoxin domain-containing protein [Nocardia terpenica]NQE90486.1 thioredoxin domain-containing protein [Nocardia terpenica]
MKSRRSRRFVNRATRRRRLTVGVVLTVAVLAAFVAAVVHYDATAKRDRDRAAQARAAAEAPPPVFTDRGTLRFGAADAPTVLTVTTDFACPSCRTFAQASDSALAGLIDGHRVAVDYDPVAIATEPKDYAARAANASACVAAADKNAWPAWYRLMFQHQPGPKDPSPTDDRLVDLAAQSGVTGPDVAGCIRGEHYRQFVTAHTDHAIAAGLTHTPTVRVGDRVVENITPDGLHVAIDRAAAK